MRKSRLKGGERVSGREGRKNASRLSCRPPRLHNVPVIAGARSLPRSVGRSVGGGGGGGSDDEHGAFFFFSGEGERRVDYNIFFPPLCFVALIDGAGSGEGWSLEPGPSGALEKKLSTHTTLVVGSTQRHGGRPALRQACHWARSAGRNGPISREHRQSGRFPPS